MVASLDRLQAQVSDDVPLAAAAGIKLVLDEDGRIEAHAPFDANRNMHGSAFGGSLYVVALVCGFAQSNWLLNNAGIDASVVVQHAHTRYQRPVHGDLVARVQAISNTQEAAFVQTFEQRQRARIDLTMVIGDATDTPPAFELEARFVARAHSSDNSGNNHV